mmetsp:Transcript_7619/g.23435  ORF Transcript_7619/g.23435 Transcript_7619/m.23435 type:complete len:529 (-) Transcript_7619:101-1687(-)
MTVTTAEQPQQAEPSLHLVERMQQYPWLASFFGQAQAVYTTLKNSESALVQRGLSTAENATVLSARLVDRVNQRYEFLPQLDQAACRQLDLVDQATNVLRQRAQVATDQIRHAPETLRHAPEVVLHSALDLTEAVVNRVVPPLQRSSEDGNALTESDEEVEDELQVEQTQVVGRPGVLERSWSLSVDTSKRLYQVAARRAPAIRAQAQPALIKERSARVVQAAREFFAHPSLSLHNAYDSTAQSVKNVCTHQAHNSMQVVHARVEQAKHTLVATARSLQNEAARSSVALGDKVRDTSATLTAKVCQACGQSYARVCEACQRSAALVVQGTAAVVQRVARNPYVTATAQRTQNTYAIARQTLISQSKQPNAWPLTRSVVTALLRTERAVATLSTSVLSFTAAAVPAAATAAQPSHLAEATQAEQHQQQDDVVAPQTTDDLVIHAAQRATELESAVAVQQVTAINQQVDEESDDESDDEKVEQAAAEVVACSSSTFVAAETVADEEDNSELSDEEPSDEELDEELLASCI